MVKPNDNPPPELPPVPKSHKTIQQMYERFMTGTYGQSWVIGCHPDQRRQLKAAFFASYSYSVIEALQNLNGYVIDADYAASILHWREELEAYAVIMSKPKGKK